MEEFVAVKPLQDLSIGVFGPLMASLRTAQNAELEKLKLIDPVSSKLLSVLKQEALLFDKIYIVDENDVHKKYKDTLSKYVITELEWLQKENVFSFVSGPDISDEAISRLDVEEYGHSVQGLLKLLDETRYKKHTNLFSQSQIKVDEVLGEMDKYKKLASKLDNEPHDEQEQLEKYRLRSKKNMSKMLEAVEKLQKIFEKVDDSVVKNAYQISEYLTRIHTLKLEYFDKIIAIPLLSYTSYLKKFPESNSSIVAQIVINDLPLPAADTPWEKIIEYRNNQENQNNLRMLRRWIRKISTENLSSAECKQELDWLKNEFQAHLRLHQIKANAETFEAIIKAPLEILENLVTFKYSKLVDPLFAVKKRRISLMEAELNAPGREIAYLIKSKQSF
jgi:hypothetical protein